MPVFKMDVKSPQMDTIGTYAFGGLVALLQMAEDESFLVVTRREGGESFPEQRFNAMTQGGNAFGQAKECFTNLVSDFIYRTSRSMMCDGPSFSDLEKIESASRERPSLEDDSSPRSA